jgi:hypothetical protein
VKLKGIAHHQTNAKNPLLSKKNPQPFKKKKNYPLKKTTANLNPKRGGGMVPGSQKTARGSREGIKSFRGVV